LTFFEALFKANNAKHKGSGHFAGPSFSYADIVLFNGLDVVTSIEPECLKAFPNLAEFKKRIETRPRIAAYLASRPESGL
jgi:glutathione S-transferase